AQPGTLDCGSGRLRNADHSDSAQASEQPNPPGGAAALRSRASGPARGAGPGLAAHFRRGPRPGAAAASRTRRGAEVSQALEPAFLLESFRDHLGLEAGNTPNTVENYLRDLRRFVQFAATKRVPGPGGVSRAMLRDFVFMLKDLGLAPATIRRNISALHTYFAFLVGEGALVDDPSDRLETPKRGRSLPDVLSVAEVEALLPAPAPDERLGWRDRALLELGYGAGLRVSELCALEISDLLLSEGLVRVFGKGNKERMVPLGRKVVGPVSLYLNSVR